MIYDSFIDSNTKLWLWYLSFFLRLFLWLWLYNGHWLWHGYIYIRHIVFHADIGLCLLQLNIDVRGNVEV